MEFVLMPLVLNDVSGKAKYLGRMDQGFTVFKVGNVCDLRVSLQISPDWHSESDVKIGKEN
jgi:hypothetical protein